MPTPEDALSKEQIETVQATLGKILPRTDDVAAIFYARLFELDPSVKPLFKNDMNEQGKKLMRTIAMAVGALGNFSAMLPVVEQMGRNHVDYGVVDAHYDTVGEALLWALGQTLADDFTPDVEQAWAATYTLVADTMKNAAHSA